MNIRKLRKDELDLAITMSEFAFQYKMKDEEREQRKSWMNPEDTWVAEEDGELLSKVTVLPFTTYIGGKEWAMGGVSGVATWPEQRRSGLVKELLAEALTEMKEKGQTVSYLYPFSIPFYRQFGWELFANKTEITIPKDKLPKRRPNNGHVRRVEKNDRIVGPIYEEWAKGFNGPLKRESTWWERSVFKRKEGELAVYYSSSNEPRGFLFYQVNTNVLTAHQMIWLDHEAREGLWTFISNHDSMIKEAVVTLPGNDGTVFLLDDPHVEQKVSSYFMARIVDVKGFLEQYPFKASVEDSPVILHVEDNFCDWNNGTYIVKLGQSEGEPTEVKQHQKSEQGASCAHPPKRGLSININTLSALLINAQSVDMLYETGRIRGPKEDANRLRSLLSTNNPFFYDFF
ncbi:GNAT family N-acetyltransferase [Alteribacter aurantiacus]|uniref:GNAT family N-acetyltransferase n=1 Tax=Alteribacter aurantiacus TaxID=254410 RepID=UPI000406DE8B|nr:GNAT family N-acetyltransferase [Alteribacter aurantiacus]